MADLVLDGSDVVLRLTVSQKIWGFHANLRAPLTSVRSVAPVAKPWTALRGRRMAGIAVPGVVAYGTRIHGDGFDFCVLRRDQPAVQIELATGRFSRWVVGIGPGLDAWGEAVRLSEAAGIAPPQSSSPRPPGERREARSPKRTT